MLNVRTERQHLEHIELNIAACQAHIQRQLRLIGRLHDGGYETARATNLLHTYRDSLRVLLQVRREMLGLEACAERRTTTHAGTTSGTQPAQGEGALYGAGHSN